jgi:hypothetical protein
MGKFIILFIIFLPINISAQNVEQETFINHFYDIENIEDYIKSIDTLIDTGESNVYDSLKEIQLNAAIPKIKSKNGISMVYTLTHTEIGVVIQFSISRTSYLPKPLGMNILSLFRKRSGWPAPMYYQVSKKQVFISDWIISNEDFKDVKKQLKQIRLKIRKDTNYEKIFGDAMKDTINLIESNKSGKIIEKSMLLIKNRL